MDAAAVVQAYAEAWETQDPDRRRELLEAAWADDGVYCDPRSTVTGRDALAEHVAAFGARMPGHRIVVTSGLDEHDGFGRFAWQITGPDGSPVVDGLDVVTFAADGRIARIVGFFGALPPAP